MRTDSLILAALLAAAASSAQASEARCWFEHGVVVVSAEVAGVTGDFILDTGQAQTTLAETQAQAAGYEATELTGEVRLAGLSTTALPIVVRDIDVRTGLFATPIAGVIGADALKPYVLDLSLEPCRLALWPAGRAPRAPRGLRLPLTWIAGVPATGAAVSDGAHAFTGQFALATGSDTPVRLSDAYAAAPGAPKPRELYPYGVDRPRLRALSFAGRLAEQVPGGLITAPDPALAGEIGAPILWAWRVRFDFPAARLTLFPKKKGPGEAPRP